MRKANATIWILGWGLALLLTWAPMAGADTYTYTYNAADQLASVQGPNGAASYTYDGDGQRTTRSTAAGQTIYVRDPQGEVIAEYSGTTGALVAEYVYVDGQRLCKSRTMPRASSAGCTTTRTSSARRSRRRTNRGRSWCGRTTPRSGRK